jgi:hypothetical protein
MGYSLDYLGCDFDFDCERVAPTNKRWAESTSLLL